MTPTDGTTLETQESTVSEDGRNYFRLKNIIGIAAFPLPSTAVAEHDYVDAYDARLSVPPILSLLNQSREAQIDNNNILKQIRGKNGNVGRYLERLNDRLDLLQKAILFIDKSFPKMSWQWMHYSEAGVDFLIPHSTSQHPNPLQTSEKLSVGDRAHLILGISASDLLIDETNAILPSNHYLYQPHSSPAGFVSVIARVVTIDDETAALRIGCAFEHITDFDRQFMARHILAVQSFRRRIALDAEP